MKSLGHGTTAIQTHLVVIDSTIPIANMAQNATGGLTGLSILPIA